MQTLDEIDDIDRPYRDLHAWRQGLDLAERVARLVATHTRLEGTEIAARMRSAAMAVPSEIAAGATAGGRRAFRRRLGRAASAVADLETCLSLLGRLERLSAMRLEIFDFRVAELARQIRALRDRLTPPPRRAA